MLGRIALGFCGLWALAVGGSALGEAISPKRRSVPRPIEPTASNGELRELAREAQAEMLTLRREAEDLRDENRRLREDSDA